MNPIRKALTGLSVSQYNEKHLQIINQFFPVQITKTEIKVLAEFMALKGDIVNEHRFGPQARNIIKEKLKMSDGGLSNHIGHLVKKGYILINDTGKYYINALLIPEEKEQWYEFKIIKE